MDLPHKNRKTEDLEETSVSRSGRVRKKSSKLTDFESPDGLDSRRKRSTPRNISESHKNLLSPKQQSKMNQHKTEQVYIKEQPEEITKDDLDIENDSYNDLESQNDSSGDSTLSNDTDEDYDEEQEGFRRFDAHTDNANVPQEERTGKEKVSSNPLSPTEVTTNEKSGSDVAIYEAIGTQPIDVAAHLSLLGERLTVMGERFTEHEILAGEICSFWFSGDEPRCRIVPKGVVSTFRQSLGCNDLEERTRWGTILQRGSSPENQKEHKTLKKGQIAESESLSVLLDSLLCALGSLMCLTQQVPELNCCPPEQLSQTLDNISHIMPDLGEN